MLGVSVRNKPWKILSLSHSTGWPMQVQSRIVGVTALNFANGNTA